MPIGWCTAHPGTCCAPAYVELWLAPLGAYRLLGLPMDAPSGQVVELTDVLGADSRRLADQLRDTPSWRQRFGLLDAYLLRRAQDGPDPTPEVAWAWRRLVATAAGCRSAGWPARPAGATST